MRGCVQARFGQAQQSVWEHGQAVLGGYEALLLAAASGQLPEGWRPPKWWSPAAAAWLLAHQPQRQTMARYLLWHDCGKPAALVLDAQGRAHFPGHAQVSADTWRALGGTADEVWLIRHDMVLHSGSAADCAELLHTPEGRRLWPGLLLAALSEVHANAQMFGGTESTSFKAKAKQLDRRGTQLLGAAGANAIQAAAG